MDFTVDVPGVSFMIDADSEEEAIQIVEERLADIAWDWHAPYVS
jgi:hypothetical protein